jgi:hypothetical protein
MGREYGVGIIPMLQFPDQLTSEATSAANANTNAEDELTTNCHSILTGSVSDDDTLTARLSGSEVSEAEITNRLTNLRQDRWLFKPATPRDEPTVKAFKIHEGVLPPGHPEGPEPLSAREETAFQTAVDSCQDRTLTEHGIDLDATEDTTMPADTMSATASIDDETPTDLLAHLQQSGFQTTLPLVDTLPGTAMYEPAANAVVCETCGVNRPATSDGLRATLACHGSLDDIDRAAIPPVALGLTLTTDEIGAAPVALRLLCALQIIANMAHQRYTPWEVDLVHDSPHDVLGLFGIDSQDIQQLKEEGLITVDTLRGYSYYTVTADGRDLLQQPHRKGVEWGHGVGDNTETLLHIAMVDALQRYVDTQYVTDPDSPIESVIPYFEVGESDESIPLDGGTRFDVVGLDAEGHIRLIGEAERHNNDARTAAVADYDKIATASPKHALWVVPSSSAGHEAVLTPLADPTDGSPRIDSYSESTRIPSISGIDEPGMTGIFTLNELRKQLEVPSLSEAVGWTP